MSCKSFRESLIEHGELIRKNVPSQLYLEMNILSYYSLVDDMNLYFKSFKFVFAKLINGISAEDFLKDVHPWIDENCPARDIVHWGDKGVLETGDVIFYTPSKGFLKDRVMNLVVTDPDNNIGMDWRMKDVEYTGFNKVSVLTPTSVEYHEVGEGSSLEQWSDWDNENGSDWYKEYLRESRDG